MSMNKKNMIRGCLFFIIIAGSIMIWQRYTFHKIQQNKIQQNLKNNLIRFHVRANSDSSFDQACKLKVRDAVISKVSQMMDKADTKEEAFDILKKQKDSIKNTAQEILKKEGVIQKVKVHFVQEKFPEKTYGQYTFPEGIYDALRIDLGEAKGHNWWCVMYPNMCFEGSVYEVVDGKSEKVLKDTLSETEYQSLMEEKNYKISWKWLDFWDK